ncbi:MAG: antibiotic biosynthesis monooxygenase [Pseudomonadales bacterium]|nr:antibiotic biosynthesis monooxygenase [Pseudomonadales bacterium]
MIIVHGTFPIRLEVREKALDLMRQMSSATREEEGCVSYEFFIGLSNPNTLLLFQEWETVDALHDHFKTPHMELFLKELPDILDGEVSTRRYEVRSADGMLEEEEFVEFEQPLPTEYRDKIVH